MEKKKIHRTSRGSYHELDDWDCKHFSINEIVNGLIEIITSVGWLKGNGVGEPHHKEKSNS